MPNDADSLTGSDLDAATEPSGEEPAGQSDASASNRSTFGEMLADGAPARDADVDEGEDFDDIEDLDFENASFWLDEEAPVDEDFPVLIPPAPADVQVSDPSAASRPLPRMSRAERRRRVRLQARRVRRIVRHIEPWSVLKISLLFYACLWIIFLVAGFMIWGVAESSGTIGKVESLVQELFALETFDFDAAQIFRGYALGGLALAIAGTTFNVLMCLLFNLISDLTGGLRITMIEEETARPTPPRRRRRRPPPRRRP